MNHAVPPSFDLEESSFVSFVGVGMREVVIVGSGLVLGIAAGLTIPFGWPVKIGVGTLLCAFGVWLAIGREPGSNRAFEEVFLDFLRFQRRPKVHQRHYQPTPEEDPFSTPDEISDNEKEYEHKREDPSHARDKEPHNHIEQPAMVPAAADQPQDAHSSPSASRVGWDVSQLPELDQLTRKQGWFKIRPIPLTPAALLNVLGVALLAGILAWVWMGGLEAAIAKFSGF